jgi:hypothetical protein
VDVLRSLKRAHDGHGRASVDGNLFPAKLGRVERILHTLVYRHVAADDGDRLDLHVRVLERHNQRNGVI